MASHGTDQTLVQRVLAARNERDGKAALLGSGVIVFIQFALFLVIGVMLFVFYQHAAPGVVPLDRDQIFPAFIVTRDAAGDCGTGAGGDFGCGDVECERIVELAGFIEHHGFRRGRARAARDDRPASC